MPPWREWYRGRAAIRAFYGWAWRTGTGAVRRSVRLVPTAANRQPAFAQYARGPDGPEWRAHSINLLTLQDDAIGALISFRDPRLFASFGLPDVLSAPASHDAAPPAARGERDTR